MFSPLTPAPMHIIRIGCDDPRGSSGTVYEYAELELEKSPTWGGDEPGVTTHGGSDNNG